MSPVLTHPEITPQRPHGMTGRRGFEPPNGGTFPLFPHRVDNEPGHDPQTIAWRWPAGLRTPAQPNVTQRFLTASADQVLYAGFRVPAILLPPLPVPIGR